MSMYEGIGSNSPNLIQVSIVKKGDEHGPKTWAHLFELLIATCFVCWCYVREGQNKEQQQNI